MNLSQRQDPRTGADRTNLGNSSITFTGTDMNRRGQAIVEFTLIALLLFTFVFAIIDFAYMFYVQLTMQHAVREGVRYAITHPIKDGDPRAALIDKIKEHAYGLYEKNANSQKDPSIRE